MSLADPAYAMQVAIAAQLLADPGVSGLVGRRVKDPLSAQGCPLPYVAIAGVQVIGMENTVADASEVYVELDAYADGPGGSLVAEQIAAAVRVALGPPPSVAGHVVDSRRYEGAKPVIEPDGLTARRRLTYRYLTHPAP